MFFNPCKCECEKEIIRTELIVIAKQFSPIKIKPLSMSREFNDKLVATVALEPKQMKVNKRNAFKDKMSSLFENNGMLSCKQKQRELTPFLSSKGSVSTVAITQNPKTLSIVNSQQMLMTKNQRQQKQLQEKMVLKLNLEEQPQRKTLKAHNNPTNQRKELNFDMTLTTKRSKKRQSMNLVESKNISVHQIDKISQEKFDSLSNKENLPNGVGQILNENNKAVYQAIKLMKEEISILKNQLERLENNQQQLINEKNQNHKFFQQDYAINQKKKQSLKRNCIQRSQELNQLKQLLAECRNRNV